MHRFRPPLTKASSVLSFTTSILGSIDKQLKHVHTIQKMYRYIMIRNQSYVRGVRLRLQDELCASSLIISGQR